MTQLDDFTTLRTALLKELDRALKSIDTAVFDQLRAQLRAAPRVFIAGQGRSGLVMRAFAMRLMHLGHTVHVIGDVTTPAITPDDVLLIGSGSGRTASLVQYAERAAAIGTNVTLITSATTSPIHAHAVNVVRIDASTPKLGTDSVQPTSIQPMAALFEQVLLLLLDLLIMQLMHDLDQTPDSMFARHANLE